MYLQVGKPAPDFQVATMLNGEFSEVKLSDYKGKWLVIFFYPKDFTFVCPTEILEMAKNYDKFKELGAEVIGGSTDSVYCHKAWTEHELGKLPFPLFSDAPREMSRDFGVLIEEKGYALRGTFIIDPEGLIRYHLVHDEDVGRSADETLRVLSSLQTGQLCPANWHPGEKTLTEA